MNKIVYILKLILSILQAVFIGLSVAEISAEHGENWQIMNSWYLWILIGLVIIDFVCHIFSSYFIEKRIKNLQNEIKNMQHEIETETTKTTKTTKTIVPTKTTEMTETSRTIVRVKQISETVMKIS